jgi:hypothetical protein
MPVENSRTINCPTCGKPVKPIIVNGLQGRNYKGELMWHCCGIYPPFTLKKEATMKKPKARKK